MATKLLVKPVTDDTWSDFKKLFQSRGAPKYCWCMVWRATGEEKKHTDNAHKKKYIKKRVDKNIPIGLLAYSSGDAIAWCSVAPRETYKNLGGDDALEKVWSLACFYIKRDFRKSGLTYFLIEHAKKYARKNGAKYLEAYPVNEDSPSYRFMGFLKTFEKVGFKFIKKAGTRRHVMVCSL